MLGVTSVLILIVLIINVESVNILAVFPVPSISHQVVFRPLTQELANRGHNVTVITTDPIFPEGRAPPNFTEINTHSVSYSIWNKVITKSRNDDFVKFVSLLTDIFDAQLQIPEVQNAVKGEYDLLIVEACVRTAVGLSHVIKAPVIQISSFGGLMINYYQFGAPINPLVYPTAGRHRTYNLSLWDKAVEIFKLFNLLLIAKSAQKYEHEMMIRNFDTNMPAMADLEKNVHLIFLNENPIWADSRPVPSNIVYIGGIHEAPVKELPEDLKTYLDSSKHGVVFLSFGTNVKLSMLPPGKMEIILKVFSQLPYDVLWKWDEEIVLEKSSNILTWKWFPQADLLRHPKVRLFVTQCGLQSTDEAISAGVPLIGIPIFADQWYNAEKYEKHGIGVQLDMKTLTEDKFRNAVETVIGDESFRKNIVKLRAYNHDQPQKPLERAVWWTEYVLRHDGARHLMAPAVNVSWAEYYELKVVSVLSVILIIIVVIVVFILRSIMRMLSKWLRINVKIKTH